MVTPASGQISMLDMRSEITRGTGAISMSEVRTRYGGSGQINFSDLYDSEGFQVTSGFFRSKFVNRDGYSTLAAYIGSVDPAEGTATAGGNTRLSFVAGSWLAGMHTTIGTANTVIELVSAQTAAIANGTAVATGYKPTDITRVVIANVSRTIQSTSVSNTTSFANVNYTMANSGTVHCLIKF